ncbi:tetratricopeptide repeat protein [Denitromonas iodatirespirans]|uniref:Tetratricopeptide repeat protein n=1 Tax=Denitromonas iodatirespirans TaxID=2795389 RepID=A0A944D498_DENI1|nr:tetratricopeptide repeat protein [Denitromonas iodatirespirans]MBT0959669.1 tetratricopeptide repeat protein [Denitromonas iodatirespirans]
MSLISTLCRPLLRLAMLIAAGLAPLAVMAQPAVQTPLPEPVAEQPGPQAGMPGQELLPQVLYGVLLAEIAGARGRMDVAVPVYLELVQLTRDVRVAQRATEVALYARRLDAAQQAAAVWAELDPESTEAKRVLAGTIGGQASAEQVAMRLAEALANSGARLPGDLLSLNRVLARMTDKAMVRQIIDRVTEPYLDYAEAHFARAHAAFAARDEAASLAALDQAIRLRPDWDQPVLLKAQIQHGTDPALAVRTLAGYLAEFPDNITVRRAYGRALVSTRQYEDARKAFEAVLVSEADDQSSRYAVAMIALEMGDLDAAEQQLDQLQSGGYPDKDAIELALGQVFEARGDEAGALAHYEAVAQSPRRERAQLQIVRMLAKGGAIDEARARLQALGDADGREEYILLEAQLLRDAGQLDAALQVADAGLKQVPESADLLYESAMLLERMGRIDAMEGRLRKLIALKPDYAHAYNALGYSLADRGMRLDEAERLIRKAVELSPGDAFILDSLGWVRFKQGHLDEARNILQKAYTLRSDPEIAAHLGEVIWTQGDRQAARETWQAAAQQHPDNAVLKAVMHRFGL